ncbi:MAG: Rpn family recombination-promoting nuclease/putative transposase [Lachnospiraceae bacterium]|nr:Rpn family recombination-promoting nuclease/putative transposase [Lachnospiraceae bacterium]MCM1239464.1 Rpn family recombination-promoting nuclease/putative transposase [Lachnospiraceae bacterium]
MNSKNTNHVPIDPASGIIRPDVSPGTISGTDLDSATGPVSIPMYNDYLFRALLQQNNRVLKGLICSLLHLDSEQVRTVSIRNPIELGDTIDSRDFFLDVKVLMNDQAYINLEMQVINEHNWTDRSLSYLCRSFDHLEHGQDYRYAKPTIQIGLLNFTLFPENPEFYATYQFLNVKNHMLYSDKLRLSVLNLTRIDLATEEDRSYHIDYWASLFKSTTWEEIKMLAQKDDLINDASNTIYQLTREEKIRLQCEAREDYYRRQNYVEEEFSRKEAALADKDAELAEKDAQIADKDAQIADKDAQIADKNAQIADKNAQIADKDAQIADKNAQIADKNAQIADKDAEIACLKRLLSDKESVK